jgi:hypothetical protein
MIALAKAGFARRSQSAGGCGEAEREGASVASGCVAKVQVPKSPKGEASGVGVVGGGRRAKRTLSGFP